MPKTTDKIFVFGSNLQSIHRRGAAKDAIEFYGAVYGQGEGLQGNSYALPTKETPWRSLDLAEVNRNIREFIRFAKNNPDMQFYVTKVGCGLAGFTVDQIKPIFDNYIEAFGDPDNCEFTWDKEI